MPDWVAVLYLMFTTAESKNRPSNTVGVVPPVAGGVGVGVGVGVPVAGGVVPLPVPDELAPPSPPPPPPQALRKQKEMPTSKVQANFFMWCRFVAE